MRRRLVIVWLAFAACVLAIGSSAFAHLTPNSEVQLTIGDRLVTADVIVPQGEYAYATGNPVDNGSRAKELARRYLADRTKVWTPEGRPWEVRYAEPEFVQIEGPPDLHAVATFTPPLTADTNRFTVEWRAVIDNLPNHFALFVIQSPGREREIAGAVRSGSDKISIERSESSLAILRSAVLLGARHIATGYDHLLFLLALLLPAPLIARGGQWRDRRTTRSTLGQLARIVTAFTIGHSLTLVVATLGGWSLPVAPVEIAIAASVLVSALHAIKPVFPGREPLVAGGFGLVHGLAFATLVHDADAGLASSAAGLFGFNLGIELVQLAVVLAVAPVLVLLSRWSVYRVVRIAGAIGCASAAGVWVVARSVDATDGLLSGGAVAVLVVFPMLIIALRAFNPSRGLRTITS